MRWLRLACLCTMLAHAAYAMNEDTLHFGKFGQITVYHASASPSSVALFVSGDGGWNKGVVDMARLLADEGALVAGIDITHFLRQLSEGRDQCVYPAEDFASLAQYLQKQYSFATYSRPILVGYSSGATLVYALLVQAPGNTFAGALSLGFCPDLEFDKPFCRGEGLEYDPLPNGKGFSFRSVARVPNPWAVFIGDIDKVCDAESTRAFVNGVAGAKLIELTDVGHGFSVQAHWAPQFRAAYRELAESTRSAESPPRSSADSLGNLPVVECPRAISPRDGFVMLWSGDGGWSSFDQGVADQFNADGFPVVGINSLKYFWKKRTPEETARDAAQIARYYARVWSKSRLILAGYSFGADILPFIYNRLPDDVRKKVAVTVMIGPSHHADFEFHVTEWLHVHTESGLPVLPELQKMKGAEVLGFFGTDEKESLCHDASSDLIQCIEIGGGHHLGNDYQTIVGSTLQKW
jgi:type IV secretory pathway VirJ component